MKKHLSRSIALLLSVVMLLSAGFVAPASAAEAEPAAKQAMELHRDKDGNTWVTPKAVEAEEEAAPVKQSAVKTETKKVNTSAKKTQTATSAVKQSAKNASSSREFDIDDKDWTQNIDTVLDIIENEVPNYSWVQIRWYTNGNVVLPEDLVIPENCSLGLMENAGDEELSFTIPEGVTMTLNGSFHVEGTLYVNGSLVNNSQAGVDNLFMDHGTQMIFADGSSYQGEGRLWGLAETDDPSQVFIGLDLSKFDVTCYYEGGLYWCEISYNADAGDDGDDDHEDDDDYYEGYSFSDFAELKAMVADAENYRDTWYYGGEGPFVFEESIELPDWATLDFTEAQVSIPAGVTVSGANLFYASDLLLEGTLDIGILHVNYGKTEVAGTLKVNEWITVEVEGELCVAGQANVGYIELYGKLNITGKAFVEDTVYSYDNGELTGKENVVFAEEWGGFQHNVGVSTLDELKAFYAKAEQSTDSRDRFGAGWYLEQDVVLKEDLTVPANAYLDISRDGDESLTIAQGVTLTLNGDMYLYTDLYVKGTLDNNGYMFVEGFNEGKLVMESGSSYTGRGRLEVNTEDNSLAGVVEGLNLDDFQVSSEWWDDYYHWTLRSTAGLTKLATPTDLKWGYDVLWNWDEETNKEYTTLVESVPGSVAWKNALPSQNEYEVDLYKVEADEDVYISGIWVVSGSLNHHEYYGTGWFTTFDLESGDYYFTVCNRGDGTEYTDSDVAKSEIWHYEKPAKKLDDTTKPVFNWPEVSWTGSGNQERYLVEWYFAESEDEEPQCFMTEWTDGNISMLWSEMIKERGVGYYSVRVRALSSNLEEVSHGDWSEMSDVYFLSELTPEMDEKLDEILLNDSLSVEEKVDAVQSMDTEELRDAMIKNNEVVDRIAELEYAAGGPAAVEVNDDAAAFDASKISVVGANLNNAADAAADIKLVVDKPQQDHVIPEAFNNAVAVSFSLDLANVEDPHDLAVPVEITLPVPAHMNPEFMVILHYDVDGNYEQIEPYIFAEGKQLYASFVVTGFSDFMLISVEDTGSDGQKGDVNADGYVNDEDVILLLWHTLLPDMYPIDCDADFTDDGFVNDEDVILLLWHTLLPDLYPL